MQSRPGYIGFQGIYSQLTKPNIGFREEYDDEIPKIDSSDNKKSNSNSLDHKNKASSFDDQSIISKPVSSSSYSSKSNENSDLPLPHLCTQLLSAIYTEIVKIWFKEEWLIFADNHKETFLILKSDITGCLTVQMAINQNFFINNKLPLLYQPECLLIRTEANNKSLFLANSNISLEHLFHRKRRPAEKLPQGKLIAIICQSNEINSKLMFYKHSLRNYWYILFNASTPSSKFYSNMLSNDEQVQLESILEQNNQTIVNNSSQLPFPLSALCNHPITYVYITQKINDEN